MAAALEQLQMALQALLEQGLPVRQRFQVDFVLSHRAARLQRRSPLVTVQLRQLS
jgi:hypothetical protein